jgi:hypothetical protein
MTQISEQSSPIIGIVGPRGAGKDTAAEYYEQRGFMHVSLSDQLRAEAAIQGRPADRPNLRALGQELRTREGGGALVVRAVEFWHNHQPQNIARLIISGHFTPEETQEIQSEDGLIAYVDALEEIRLDREIKRRRGDCTTNLSDFRAQEEIEMYGLAGPNTPNLNFAKQQADVIIWNNTGFAEFYEQLDKLL